VTLEPCAHHGQTGPCAEAVVSAGIARVVSALEDPNPQVSGQGHARLRAAGVAVEVGVGREEAARAHAGHIRRVLEGRPHVTLKLAISADGKVGLAGRRPVAITGEAAGARVHLLRAMNDAILVGLGTALSDDPLLTCRLPGMGARSPVRVVLDAELRLPVTSRLARTAREAPVWAIAGPSAAPDAVQALRDQGVDILTVDAAGDRVEIGAALQALAARGITRVLVEGGPTVAAALVRLDLIDEAWLFRSSRSVGADGVEALEGLPLSALTRSRLISRSIERVGDDELE
jgi:diaminohydroxyphosphoribosylaminopyrimidine deaminase/5-amino-6-(5-phosphoribosylamino)uracil reductase